MNRMALTPTRDDWRDWKNNPVTKWVFQELNIAIQNCRESMGSGATLDSSSVDKTALITASHVGFIDGLNEIFKLEPRDKED